ncbi:hypothetical protein LDENG_00247980 [Lucifuga dentata]|nr:hypothetical protein LDENG_00247980 [Lucifuga dentata]
MQDKKMTASWDLPFPLVIIYLVLIRGYTPVVTTSRVPATNLRPLRPRGSLMGTSEPDDYNIFEDPTTIDTPNVVTPVGKNPQLCDYNPCLELPCSELEASTGCLCPGLTLYSMAPEAPNLKTVFWNGSDVVVKWCAPLSYVTAYKVMVGGKERKQFGKGQRSGGVGEITRSAEVCVVAVNDAGVSAGSCKIYEPRDDSLPLKLGITGGGLGFLLLFTLAVLLWRHKRERKAENRISMQNMAETQITERLAAQ